MKPTKQAAPACTFIVHDVDQRTFLAFRDIGAATRKRLEDELARCAPTDALVIDFRDIEAMSNSYADELIGKFYVALAAGDVAASTVRLAGLNEETRDAISVCLERRKLAAVDADLGTLIGQAAAIEDTYIRAVQLGEFRAGDIAEAMEISLTNANNRLKRLVDAGALHRERTSSPEHGGKEFTYRVPQLEATTSAR